MTYRGTVLKGGREGVSAHPGRGEQAGRARRELAGSGPVEASVPPAWLVVVAFAALLGALGGTRLAARRRS